MRGFMIAMKLLTRRRVRAGVVVVVRDDTAPATERGLNRGLHEQRRRRRRGAGGG